MSVDVSLEGGCSRWHWKLKWLPEERVLILTFWCDLWFERELGGGMFEMRNFGWIGKVLKGFPGDFVGFWMETYRNLWTRFDIHKILGIFWGLIPKKISKIEFQSIFEKFSRSFTEIPFRMTPKSFLKANLNLPSYKIPSNRSKNHLPSHLNHFSTTQVWTTITTWWLYGHFTS